MSTSEAARADNFDANSDDGLDSEGLPRTPVDWGDESEQEGNEELMKFIYGNCVTPTAFIAATADKWSKVRLLLRDGYDVNARCPYDLTKIRTRRKEPRVMCNTNRTLLHMAAVQEDLEAVRMLIDLGADLDVQDDRGATPLMLATSKDKVDVVEALLSNGADVRIVSYDGPLIIDSDDEYNEGDFIDVHPPLRHDDNEYENKAFEGRKTCLHYALMGRKPYEIVRLLLQYGADVNAQDGIGWTALHTFYCPDLFKILLATPGINIELTSKDVHFPSVSPEITLGGTPLYCVMDANIPKEAELLLSVGANPNVTDRGREKSPFMMAVSFMTIPLRGKVSLMRKLAAAGADVNWRNRDGENALTILVGGEKRFYEVDELLTNLAPAIDLNVVSVDGTTALMRAVRACEPRIIRRLLQAGADVSVSQGIEIGNTRAENAPNEKAQASAKREDWVYGSNVVNAAAERGRRDILIMVLEHRPRVDLRYRNNGQTSFIYCADNCRYAMLEPLARAGADINATDHEGNTALHWAARKGYKECIKALLKLGVDTSITNKEGKTALDACPKKFKHLFLNAPEGG